MARLGEAVLLDAFRLKTELLPDAWGLLEDSGFLLCRGYAAGIDLDLERASVELPDGLSPLLPTCIPADSLAIYAPDSFAFLLGSDPATAADLGTWDAGGSGVLHTATTLAGRALTTPLYSGGWLYFLDYDKASSLNGDNEVRIVVRLFRSRLDLQEIEGVWQFDLVRPPTFTATLGCPCLTQEHIRFTARLLHEEVGVEVFDLAIPLAGGDPEEVTGISAGRPVTGYGLERGVLEGVFWAGPPGSGYDSEPYLYSTPDDAAGAPSPRWPDPDVAPSWATGWTEIRSLSLNSPGKSRALLYGFNAAEVVASATLANSTDNGGLSRFVVEEHPELGHPLGYFMRSA